MASTGVTGGLEIEVAVTPSPTDTLGEPDRFCTVFVALANAVSVDVPKFVGTIGFFSVMKGSNVRFADTLVCASTAAARFSPRSTPLPVR